jgi:hypothetical protein
MSDVLDAHRQRVTALNEAMQRLERMHDEGYALWQRAVQLAEGHAPDRQAELDAVHDEAYALAERIARLREETFGSISHEARLLLTSTVESTPKALRGAAPLPLHED